MDKMHGMGCAVVTPAESGTPQPCGSDVPAINRALLLGAVTSERWGFSPN